MNQARTNITASAAMIPALSLTHRYRLRRWWRCLIATARLEFSLSSSAWVTDPGAKKQRGLGRSGCVLELNWSCTRCSLAPYTNPDEQAARADHWREQTVGLFSGNFRRVSRAALRIHRLSVKTEVRLIGRSASPIARSKATTQACADASYHAVLFAFRARSGFGLRRRAAGYRLRSAGKEIRILSIFCSCAPRDRRASFGITT